MARLYSSISCNSSGTVAGIVTFDAGCSLAMVCDIEIKKSSITLDNNLLIRELKLRYLMAMVFPLIFIILLF
ncbi:Uncharacterised protein [Legionella pneumophila]|nr:Uncharacterised protein [Legionella pneumophila]